MFWFNIPLAKKNCRWQFFILMQNASFFMLFVNLGVQIRCPQSRYTDFISVRDQPQVLLNIWKKNFTKVKSFYFWAHSLWWKSKINVFIHITSVVKPAHIFTARSRVSKSCLLTELCFHCFVHLSCVPIYILLYISYFILLYSLKEKVLPFKTVYLQVHCEADPWWGFRGQHGVTRPSQGDCDFWRIIEGGIKAPFLTPFYTSQPGVAYKSIFHIKSM